jgi:cytidine deaminase
MNERQRKKMLDAAIAARTNAYAPYSQFAVGAAILCEDGEIVTGCNVENAVYGLAICAERVAVCKTVSEARGKIVAIAVAASPLASPCGACRQFLAEFNLRMEVISVDPDSGREKSWLLSDLLKDAFELTGKKAKSKKVKKV